MSRYEMRFKSVILEHSNSKTFDEAKKEWEYIGGEGGNDDKKARILLNLYIKDDIENDRNPITKIPIPKIFYERKEPLLNCKCFEECLCIRQCLCSEGCICSKGYIHQCISGRKLKWLHYIRRKDRKFVLIVGPNSLKKVLPDVKKRICPDCDKKRCSSFSCPYCQYYCSDKETEIIFDFPNNKFVEPNMRKFTGHIIKLHYKSPGYEYNIIHVTNRHSETLTFKFKFFLPFRLDDELVILISNENQKYYILDDPFFIRPTSLRPKLNYYVKKYIKDVDVYRNFVRNISHNAEIRNLRYHEYLDLLVLFQRDGISKDGFFAEDDELVRKLIVNNFYNDFLFRRLRLLGLNENEIRLGTDPLTLYESLIKNPFSVIGLEETTAIKIYKIVNSGSSPSSSMIQDGKLTKYLNRRMKSGHSYGSILEFSSNHPEINFQELASNHEGITIVDDKIYSNAYLEHELYFVKKCKKIMETVDSITEDDEKILSKYTSLDDIQLSSIKSCISSNLSILTGSAGTGKCLGVGTLVMMKNETLKHAENIKIGDFLKSPDSKGFTKVLSTTYGTDKMYKINIENNYSFECTQDHLLSVGVKIKEKIHLYNIEASKIFSLKNKLGYLEEIYLIQIKTEGGKCLNIEDSENFFQNENINSINLLKFYIEPSHKKIYYGFTIDNNGLFYLENKIVTHNTTCIKAMLKVLNSRKKGKTLLCSPTGKAADKLAEVCGVKTYTLCDTLSKNIKPINIIIDEASMATVETISKILKKHKKLKKIILVGDINQIGPIGPGYVFHELYLCTKVNINQLQKNYRSDYDQVVKFNQKFLDSGIFPVGYSRLDIKQGNIDDIKNILEIFLRNVENNLDDLMILTHTKKDLKEINSKIVRFVNTKNVGNSIIDYQGTKWKVGDKVMVTKNNYSVGIFNGQTGEIISIDDDVIKVQIKDKTINYTRFEKYEGLKLNNSESKLVSISNLIHAYAITIHKSQGSEWDYGIIYINNLNNLPTINLLYTALSRFKKGLWIICTDIKKLRTEKAKWMRKPETQIGQWLIE